MKKKKKGLEGGGGNFDQRTEIKQPILTKFWEHGQ